MISSTNDNTSDSSSKSSSSSSISNQDISELISDHHFEHLQAKTEDEAEEADDFPNLSLSDYNRKLCLINELINLHKSKMSAKYLWSISSETEITPSQNKPSLNNFTRANIKYLDLKDDEDEEEDMLSCFKVNSSICYELVADINNIVLYNVKQDIEYFLIELRYLLCLQCF